MVTMHRDAPEIVPSFRLALDAIIRSSNDAIVTKTLDGTITSWNPGAERVFGYTAEEAVGRPITMLFPPDRLDEEKEFLDRKSTRLNSSHGYISYAVFRLKKKSKQHYSSSSTSIQTNTAVRLPRSRVDGRGLKVAAAEAAIAWSACSPPTPAVA